MPITLTLLEPVTLPADVKVQVFDVLPPPPKGTFSDIPVDVGPQYEGQRVRKPEMFVELGGPDVKYKFELFRIRKPEEIEDGKVIVIGPDIPELKEGSSIPYAVIIEATGKGLEPEGEGVLERRIHEFSNYVMGYMHLNQRDQIWLRLSKKAVQKGLNTFRYIGTVLYRLFKSAFPIIEKMRVIFVTDPRVVELLYPQAQKIYEERDRRALGLRDEDVDMFYSCKLCQSFAPTHVCIITPERPSACGAISWIDARIAAKIDPKGPIQPVPKGKLLDSIGGEYEGANEAVRKLSNGAIQRVKLYSLFEYPPTICGCFEIATFYIPELNAVGLVNRGYPGNTPIGLRFSQIADTVAGGRQVPGFQGIGYVYLRSKKLFQKDGGWIRIVWMTSEIKQRVLDAIPPELRDKIATEKEATTVEELKKFLMEKGHPIVKLLKEKEKPKVEEKKEVKVEEKALPAAPPTPAAPEAPAVAPAAPQVPAPVAVTATPQQVTISPQAAGGITVSVTIPLPLLQQQQQAAQTPMTLVFKGVKIRAEKLVIKRAGTGESK
jgi:acetyl-CoA decarbonylase/synthase complex subunit beta